MKAQTKNVVAFLAMILLGSVCSQVTESVYCPSTDNLNLAVGAAELEDYDVVGQYWDAVTDNSADLFVKFTEDGGEFSFYVYNDTTGESTEIDCDETQDHTFVALVNRALITKDADGLYYICVLNEAHIESEDDIPIAELIMPAGTVNFTPFYFNDVAYILTGVITRSAASKIANFALPDDEPIVTGTTEISHVEWGTLFIKFS
jgi:hypothetical protein